MTLDGYHVGDCRDLLRQMPDECVQTCVTSPPYWGLRDYGVDGQFGLDAGSRIGDLVLDPFGGSGTVGRVAKDLGRRWCLFDLNPEYAKIAKRKTAQIGLFGRCAP